MLIIRSRASQDPRAAQYSREPVWYSPTYSASRSGDIVGSSDLWVTEFVLSVTMSKPSYAVSIMEFLKDLWRDERNFRRPV